MTVVINQPKKKKWSTKIYKRNFKLVGEVVEYRNNYLLIFHLLPLFWVVPRKIYFKAPQRNFPLNGKKPLIETAITFPIIWVFQYFKDEN